jgi:dimethylamine---corrinoid protein Co-methyltransferase
MDLLHPGIGHRNQISKFHEKEAHMSKIFSRMGDGWVIEFSEAELKRELEAGTRDAAEQGSIEPLPQDELEYLFEICKSGNKMTGVESGREVVLSYDGPSFEIRRLGIVANRQTALQIYERCFGADTIEFSHIDYSYKQVKPIIHEEVPLFEQLQALTIAPLFYGAMPNLGLYTKPDGPVSNPGELMPMGKIKEAQEAFEEAIEMSVKDMVHVASAFYEAGCDGINIDTVGAAGDPDFKAALVATEELIKKYPDINIEIGMAGEFVLGMHGEITHNGKRLAGMYPHEQVKLVEEAGAHIFGAVMNTQTNQSFPWNLARAVTFSKACTRAASIPVHGNMGIGVGALPVCETQPAETVSMASKAMVEIARLDGL